MKLMDIIGRIHPPAPWAEGEKIPWNDPAFSRRMLAEHLSQAHDAASRRLGKIDEHIRWIHGELLAGRAGRVLDLGCGPGLYTSRLARLGCPCVGIDFAPAAIEYAAAEARRDSLDCTYRSQDIRRADYGDGFALAMWIFGEFNCFHPSDAGLILAKVRAALAPGGILLLEPYTYEAVHRMGCRERAWQTRSSGLFSDRPHLYLAESHWDEAARAAITRCFIIDAATGQVARHSATTQAYRPEEIRALLVARGFEDVRVYPSLTGQPDPSQPDHMAVVARKARPAEG